MHLPEREHRTDCKEREEGYAKYPRIITSEKTPQEVTQELIREIRRKR
jgi:hypothetical protein